MEGKMEGKKEEKLEKKEDEEEEWKLGLGIEKEAGTRVFQSRSLPLRHSDASSSKTFASRLVQLTEFFEVVKETGSWFRDRAHSHCSPTRHAPLPVSSFLFCTVALEKAGMAFRSAVCLTKRPGNGGYSFCQQIGEGNFTRS